MSDSIETKVKSKGKTAGLAESKMQARAQAIQSFRDSP